MAHDDFCYLTTTGRCNGQPHRIEIWYVADMSDWRERALTVALDPQRAGVEPTAPRT